MNMHICIHNSIYTTVHRACMTVSVTELDGFEKPGSRCPVRRSSTIAFSPFPGQPAPHHRPLTGPRIVWPPGHGGRAPRPTRRIPSPVPTRTRLPRFHREIRADGRAPLVWSS